MRDKRNIAPYVRHKTAAVLPLNCLPSMVTVAEAASVPQRVRPIDVKFATCEGRMERGHAVL